MKLADRPDASAAHGDVVAFGDIPGIYSLRVADGPVFDRVMMLAPRSTPMAGRGMDLMRSESLDIPFPR